MYLCALEKIFKETMQDLETSLALVVQKLEHIERGLDEMRAHLGDKLEIHDDRLRKMEVAKEYKNKAEACSLINSKPTLVESEGSNFWITILLVVLASSVGLTIGTIVF